MKRNLKKFISLIVILSLAFMLYPINPKIVNAAGLTYLKDTLSTLTKDAFADHEIMFTTADGVDSTQTIVITFPTDFDGETGDPLDFSDVDFFVDSSPDQSCGDGTAQTLVAASPGTDEWSAIFSGTENRILTLTSGGASATVAAGYEVCIEIGENATGGAANAQYDNPTTSGEKTITFTVGTTDTGSCPVYIVDDDSVAVSGTVLESLTFAITDIEITFDTLYSTKARYAGASAGSDSAVSGHDLEVTTNAGSGYTVTYNGATLTSNGNTIDVAAFTDDADGTPGNEEFGISIATDGDATIVTEYQYTGTPNYKFVAGTTTSIISENGPTAIETFSFYYLANIGGDTHSGSYTTAITYIATANY